MASRITPVNFRVSRGMLKQWLCLVPNWRNRAMVKSAPEARPLSSGFELRNLIIGCCSLCPYIGMRRGGMDTTFVRKLILLWLLMELLLSWTVVYKETEILVLGHFAMLIGSLWAFAKARSEEHTS